MNIDCRSQGYIKGIDGLRAVAVLSVIFYHLDFTTLPGGFTGVDVFFVISGYVISRSLANSVYRNFFEYILGFYKRRIARIFPALILCLVTTTIATVLFIPQSWLSDLNSKTGLGAFFGLSNFILVIFKDGYFAPRGEFNPFLHTWSLAVEEQFYLIFPFIFYVWLTCRKNKSLTGLISRHSLGLLIFVSIAISYVETQSNADRAFYLLPSRFWELAVGSILFQVQYRELFSRISGYFSQIASFLGVGLLVIGFLFSSQHSFPFPWAIVPVCGTVFLLFGITHSTEQHSVIKTILSSAFLTYIGRISYSLYLWHWPIFTLFRWTIGFEKFLYMLYALFLTFIFSIGSFHFLESPARKNIFIREQYVLPHFVIGFFIISLSSLFCFMLFLNQSVASLSVTRDKFTWYPYEHNIYGTNIINSKKFNQTNMFVLGDSHAGAYSAMLYNISNSLGINVKHLTQGGCPVLNLLKPLSDNEVCVTARNKAIDTIVTSSKPSDIVFLASLRMIKFSDQWEPFSEEKVRAKQLITTDSKNRALVEEEASQLIEKFQKLGLQVIIDAPKPIFKSPPFRCSDWFNDMNPICSAGFSINRDILLNHRMHVMRSLEKLKEKHVNLSVWDPFTILCSQEICTAFDENLPVFFDGDHLSGYGNKLLLPSFGEHILKVLERLQIKGEEKRSLMH